MLLPLLRGFALFRCCWNGEIIWVSRFSANDDEEDEEVVVCAEADEEDDLPADWWPRGDANRLLFDIALLFTSVPSGELFAEEEEELRIRRV